MRLYWCISFRKVGPYFWDGLTISADTAEDAARLYQAHRKDRNEKLYPVIRVFEIDIPPNTVLGPGYIDFDNYYRMPIDVNL